MCTKGWRSWFAVWFVDLFQHFSREIGLAIAAGYHHHHHHHLLLPLLYWILFAFVANKNLLRAIVAIFASCKFFLSFFCWCCCCCWRALEAIWRGEIDDDPWNWISLAFGEYIVSRKGLRAWFVVLDWEDAIVMTSCLLQGRVHARTHARSILLSRKFIWYRRRLDIGFRFCTWQLNSCNNIEKVSLFVCAKIIVSRDHWCCVS